MGKWLEDAATDLFRHADAGITDHQLQHQLVSIPVNPFDFNAYRALLSKLDGIAGEIDQDLAELNAVSADYVRAVG